LPTFTFAIPFSSQKQACGLEVPPLAGLRAKSIGGKRIPLEGPPVFPQNAAGASGAPLDAPTSELPGSWGKEKLARPAQEMNRALWFLRAIPPKAGLPGRAMPKIQSTLRPLG
jgi:hypothetical protein